MRSSNNYIEPISCIYLEPGKNKYKKYDGNVYPKLPNRDYTLVRTIPTKSTEEIVLLEPPAWKIHQQQPDTKHQHTVLVIRSWLIQIEYQVVPTHHRQRGGLDNNVRALEEEHLQRT